MIRKKQTNKPSTNRSFSPRHVAITLSLSEEKTKLYRNCITTITKSLSHFRYFAMIPLYLKSKCRDTSSVGSLLIEKRQYFISKEALEKTIPAKQTYICKMQDEIRKLPAGRRQLMIHNETTSTTAKPNRGLTFQSMTGEATIFFRARFLFSVLRQRNRKLTHTGCKQSIKGFFVYMRNKTGTCSCCVWATR